MAQLIIAAAGAAALGPLGLGLVSAGTGFAIGGLVYSAFNQQKLSAPRLSDTKAPQVAYGSPIMRVYGHPRHGGNIAWQSDWREIVSSEGGKGGLGGPEVETVTYVCDLLIVFSSNFGGDGRRGWQNGKLVWSRADDSTEGSIEASDEAPWSRITFYDGAADQEPDPTYEAAVGADNAPGYRDRTSIFIQDYKGGAAAQVQVLTFEMGGTGEPIGGTPTDLFYAPYATDAEDTIEPISGVAFQPDITPDGEGLSFGDDWGSFSYEPIPTNPPGSRATQFALYVPVKFDTSAFEDDFTQPVNYRFEIRQLQPNDGSLGAQTTFPVIVFRQNELGSALSLGISLSYDSVIEGAEIVVVKGLANGTTTTETFGHIPFGSDETYYFRFEVEANPDDPGEALSTKVYVRSDEGGAYPTETFLDSHVTPNFSYILVAGLLEPPGSIYNGITGFDFRRLKVTRGANVADGRIPLAEPTLQEVVEAEHLVAGDDLAFVDATALATVFVKALPVTQVVSPRQVIESCMAAYFFTAVSSGTGVRYSFLGGAPVATIPYEDLGATAGDVDGERLPIAIANDTEIPAQVFVKYINVNDDYQDGTESSDRLISNSINTLTVDLPIGLTPEEAKRVADITVMRGAVESMRFGPFSLNRDYSALEPTDVVLIYDRYGNLHRVRLTKKTEAQGVLTFEGVRDDATIFNSAALTSGGYTNSTLVQPKVDTTFELLDISLLRDVDDFTGLYWAVNGADGNPAWPGAVLKKSPDDVTFTRLGDTTRRAILGVTDGTLGNFTGGWVFDETNVIRVVIESGTLASYTRAEIIAQSRLGAYLIGDEIIQARTATLVDTLTYDLSGLLRGRRGTDWAVSLHGPDERFVVLDEATLNRSTLSTADIAMLAYYKAVTLGRNDTTAISESLTFNAISSKPFSPVDVRGTRLSGDLTIDWKRRTRRAVNPHLGICPLGEETEAYDVVIYTSNTYTTVKRTIRTNTTSAEYTSAEQTTDFGSPQATVYAQIFQISATAGRGYAARKAL